MYDEPVKPKKAFRLHVNPAAPSSSEDSYVPTRDGLTPETAVCSYSEAERLLWAMQQAEDGLRKEVRREHKERYAWVCTRCAGWVYSNDVLIVYSDGTEVLQKFAGPKAMLCRREGCNHQPMTVMGTEQWRRVRDAQAKAIQEAGLREIAAILKK